jgi:hypothetical protein
MQKFSLHLLLFILCLFTFNFAKGQLAMGHWRDHFSYSQSLYVADAGDRVYCANELALFYYVKSQGSVQKLSKVSVDGLSDIGICAIAYHSTLSTLVVAYDDGNIDLVGSLGVVNIPDIKRKQMSGLKNINKINFIGNYAYLCCAFGLVVLDLENNEIKDTYRFGTNGADINVFDLTTDGSYFYAATEQGVYKASVSAPNLVDYSYWTRLSALPNYSSKFIAVKYFADKLFVAYSSGAYRGDVVYYNNSGNWSAINTVSCYVRNLQVSNNNLLLVTDSLILEYDKDLQELRKTSTSNPRDGITDSNNLLWVADKGKGLIRVNLDNSQDVFVPKGPPTNNFFNLLAKDNNFYSVGGSYTSSWNSTWGAGYLYCFKNETWFDAELYQFNDLVSLAIDPQNSDHVFVGSWGAGLLELNNGITYAANYNETNSSLSNPYPGDKYVRVGGLAYDSEGNLWMSNSNVRNAISVLKTDGTWKAFDYSDYTGIQSIGQLLIDNNDQKWLVLPRNEGLVVFDNKGTIDDESDDVVKNLNVIDKNGDLISNDIYAIALDKDGFIWLGTAQGVVVYYNPEDALTTSGYYAQQVEVPRNDTSGLVDYLLENEKVTCIAVDGANRKWLGTESSGAFLVSSDGSEQLRVFNTSNSSMISNNIKSIAISDKTGEVFFATDRGLLSYRDVATEGEENFDNAYVFPNPVREDYSGDITITGLVSDVNVKITDITGNLVYETTALGGQATWNGKNFSGHRVATGVYLIFCTNTDGTKTYVTKLLFIH